MPAPAARSCNLLDGVRRLGFAGVNVTFPYKEAVIDLLDEMSPTAAALGAVNAIVVRDGRLIGHNTDTTGFARAARDLVAGSGRGAVAVIGAGGVGKAIAFALAGLGVAEIRIFDTDRAKADRLAARLRPTMESSSWIASRTRFGMRSAWSRNTGGNASQPGPPVPDALLHDGLWVADVVYSPLWTPLLIAAKARNARTMNGGELAIYQAVDAFELFTGLTPSISEMRNAFDGVMAKTASA